MYTSLDPQDGTEYGLEFIERILTLSECLSYCLYGRRCTVRQGSVLRQARQQEQGYEAGSTTRQQIDKFAAQFGA